MRAFIFEGTAEEVGRVVQAMQSNSTAGAKPSLARPITDDEETWPSVTEEFVRRVLTRRRLSDPVKAMLRALSQADPEDYVPVADLYEATGYSSAQFAGLMGAFGRRIAHTEGYDENAVFFEYEETEDGRAWGLRLTEPVREVLRQENLG